MQSGSQEDFAGGEEEQAMNVLLTIDGSPCGEATADGRLTPTTFGVKRSQTHQCDFACHLLRALIPSSRTSGLAKN